MGYSSRYSLVTGGGELTGATGAPLVIGVVTDTQDMIAASLTDAYNAEFTWLNSRCDLILHTGDVVDDGDVEAQWTRAAAGRDLISADLPALWAIGNHDYDDNVSGADRPVTYWNTFVPQSWYTGKSWWGGGFYEASHSENLYFLFTDRADRDWIVLVLEYGPRAAVVAWADGLLTTHAARRAIILTHGYMYNDDTRLGAGDDYNPNDAAIGADAADGDELWTTLVDIHANVRVVFSGHILGDGTGKLVSATGEGNDVAQFLMNQQILPDADQGYVRLIGVYSDRVQSRSYKPYTNRFIASPDHQFRVDLTI